VEKLRRSLREGLPCIHAFDDDPNVELAMVVGEPVYGVDAEGKSYARTAKQVKIVRDAYRAKTSVAIPAGDTYVDLVGFKGVSEIGSEAPKKPRATKKGGKGSKASKRGGREARA
jgi:hypothetical protein